MNFGLAFLVTLFFTPANVQDPEPRNDLVAHEWGSAIVVQGSNGVVLDGIEENLAELPGFVIRWSKLPLRSAFPFKKPILYFYTGKETEVEVSVQCPAGMFTEWWPPAHSYSPRAPFAKGGPLTAGNKNIKAEKGRLYWKVRILPRKPDQPKIRTGGGWYPILRNVDAAWLHVERKQKRVKRPTPPAFNECERFLLYRGVMTTTTPIRLRIRSDNQGRVFLENSGKRNIGTVLLVRVAKGKGSLQRVSGVLAGGKVVVDSKEALAFSLPDLGTNGRSTMKRILIRAGLFEKEADGMVRIWGLNWFKEHGFRALYLLPREEIDRVLPISIKPAPKNLLRVMVGHVEILTPEREREIESRIKGLGSDVFEDRDRAFLELKSMGRMAEPLLRRTLETSKDPDVIARVKKLLLCLDPSRRARN